MGFFTTSAFRLRRRDVAEADADVEHRRERPGRHDAATLDRHSLPRDRLLGHHERDQPLPGALLLDLAQALDAGELGLEGTGPAEPGRHGVVLRVDVVAVQRVADLEPQGVTSAEAAGCDTAGEDRVPEGRRLVLHEAELDALLARVAGA